MHDDDDDDDMETGCICICSLFYDVFFQWLHLYSVEWLPVVSERRIGNYLEGSGRGIILR
jgi:hypothetical protein